MPRYLVRFSYTPETWAQLIQNPEDRREGARANLEQVGGTLHELWYAFGQYDGYLVFEAPDNTAAAAALLRVEAGGGFRTAETVVLMTVEETLEALRMAQSIQLRPSGQTEE